MSTEGLEPRVYEVGYHVLPIVGESDLDAEVNLIRSAITEKGGELIKEGSPRLTDLAYPMTKIIDNKRNEFNKAYFGWIKFSVAPEATFDIKSAMDNHPNVLRFILISTVREDTIIGEIKAPSEKKEEAVTKKEVKKETKKEDKKEETVVEEAKADKQIDETVSEE